MVRFFKEITYNQEMENKDEREPLNWIYGRWKGEHEP